MADTWQNKTTLITSSPDNTSGAITAQLFRNVITSTIPSVVFISGNYNLSLNDGWVCCLPSGSTSYSITLPDAVIASGKMYYIYKESDNTSTLTVLPSGSQQIAGVSSQTLVSKYSQLQTYSDGSGWEIVVNSDYLGWKDLTSDLISRGGASAPSYTAVGTSGFYGYEFTSNTLKEVFANYHILHDYAPRTDMYIHMHWIAPNTTAGNVTWNFQIAYAKGYTQSQFNIQTPTVVTVTTANPASGAWTHMISEVKFTDIAGASGLINSSNIQTDGVIMVRAYRNGGVTTDTYGSSVWGLFMDLHYQTRKNTTLNKNYPFD